MKKIIIIKLMTICLLFSTERVFAHGSTVPEYSADAIAKSLELLKKNNNSKINDVVSVKAGSIPGTNDKEYRARIYLVDSNNLKSNLDYSCEVVEETDNSGARHSILYCEGQKVTLPNTKPGDDSLTDLSLAAKEAVEIFQTDDWRKLSDFVGLKAVFDSSNSETFTIDISLKDQSGNKTKLNYSCLLEEINDGHGHTHANPDKEINCSKS